MSGSNENYNSTEYAERLRAAEKFMRAGSFIAAFQDFQNEAAEINKKNGFSTDDPLFEAFTEYLRTALPEGDFARFSPLFSSFRNARVGLKIALIMGELGETLEAVRKNIGPDSHCPQFTAEEVEVADAIIRLINYGVDRKLRLAEALLAKQEYNRNRHDHSAEIRASEHGKKF